MSKDKTLKDNFEGSQDRKMLTLASAIFTEEGIPDVWRLL